MKIFQKIKKDNGRRQIYFCGVKIFSYKRRNVNFGLLYPNTSCDIYCYDDYLKRGICFPHLCGIVISRAATIGNDCRIYQNVTIGAKNYWEGDGKTKENYPSIGENTVIYAGAVIVGPVKIGKNCVIGANSVVLTDVPDNSIAAGIPAKVIPPSPKQKLNKNNFIKKKLEKNG